MNVSRILVPVDYSEQSRRALEYGAALAEAFGAPIDVDDGLPEGRVDALFLPDGSLLVAWLEHAGDGAAWRCRRVRTDGTIAPSLALASTTAARSAGYLRMARAGSDTIAAWTDVGPPSRVRVARVRPTN